MQIYETNIHINNPKLNTNYFSNVREVSEFLCIVDYLTVKKVQHEIKVEFVGDFALKLAVDVDYNNLILLDSIQCPLSHRRMHAHKFIEKAINFLNNKIILGLSN